MTLPTTSLISVAGHRTVDLRPMARSANEQRVVIPYRPRYVFAPFHQRQQRFALIVAHRRCGKTVAAVNDDIRSLMKIKRQFPPPQGAFISPTYAMGKRNAWQYAKHYVKTIPGVKISEGELNITLPNGAIYHFMGSDNYESLRGMYLDKATFDEYALQNPLVWRMIVRPQLADYKGRATFIGSAAGRNHFYDLKKKHEFDPEWLTLDLRASQTGLISQEELDANKLDMPEELYLQEYENSFDAATVGAYYGKIINEMETRGHFTRIVEDPMLDTFAAFDLGMHDNTAVWVWQVHGNEWRFLDFIMDNNKTLPYYHDWLREKGYKIEELFLPHDGAVRDYISGQSRQEYLESKGYNVTVIPKAPIDDGIHAVRMTLKRCWFDLGNCEAGIDCLRMYRKKYDEKAKVWSDKAYHDWSCHGADAFRYAVTGLYEYKPSLRLEPPTIDMHYGEQGWMMG